MKGLKKAAALLICAAMIFTVSGCKAKDTVLETISEINRTEPDPGIDEIGYTLPYLRTDSLDPYKAKSEINLALATLMYDSLFTVTNSFEVKPLMAESYVTDGNKITVRLKNVKFYDGIEVSADDIVYSFVRAKRSPAYSVFLKNLSDATASDSSTVVFTMSSLNPFEAANLTFPIVKKGDVDDTSDGYSTDFSIGSGRYVFKDNGKSKFLVVNKKRLDGYHPKYNKIGLRDITEISSVPTLFSLGEIDFYTENFSDGQYKRYTGSAAKINTTKFTYLGVNGNRRALRDNRVRRAIALLLDREDIAKVAYNGYGIATVTPFCTGFYALKDCTVPSIRQNKQAAIELLEEAGFDQVSGIGIRYGNETSLEFSLAVNKGNDFRLAIARNIQQALAKANIKINIRELSYNSYVYAVEECNFDLYVGETLLPNSMDLSRFFNEGGDLSGGISEENESVSAYSQFETGKLTMQEFLDVFCDDLPFIPIAYRQGMTLRSDKIKTASKTITGDYFYNIDEWTAE